MPRFHHHKPPKPTTPTVPTTPTTPTVPVPSVPVGTPINPKLCINYGHQTNTYDLSGQVTTDFDILKKAGISRIRLAYNGWNNTQSFALASFAKSKGFHVILGGDWSKFDTTSASNYKSLVLKQAAWAQTNHIDQMSLGNEQEYRLVGVTKDQWADFILGLATEVKKIYSGKISYETSGDFADFWTSKTLGDLDLIGFNLYCGYECNKNYLTKNISAHGVDRVYVSEVNADMDTGKYDLDSVHADRVRQDVMQLLNMGTYVYYFAFGTCNGNNGVASHWGLYQCNKLVQPLTATVLGIK